MRLHHQYKTRFHLQTKSLSISDLFQYPTMIDHAQLIHQAMNIEQHFEDCWSLLHLTQGQASFAQERIFLDEQIRFSSQNNSMIYAIPLFYRVSSVDNHISITRLHRALQSVIIKHSILRTALYFDIHGTIMQQVNTSSDIDDMKSYGLEIINLQDDSIGKTINEVLNHSNLFDLSKGHVIHCHVLRHYRLSLEIDDDLLINDDMILFNIHHSAFDGTSRSIFLRDLSLAYESNCSLPMNDDTFQYIDYSVYEHQIDMTVSHDFWYSHLEGCNLERQLSLPTDRQHSSNDQRSGLSSIAEICFNNDISTSFLDYASSHQVTPFQLGLTLFYAFLFKLTHGQNDLCIAGINANRYRSELQSMIGMFVSTLPYRIRVDPRWTFDELVKHVREKCLSILEHSHYPLQHILADFHFNQSNVPFLELVFDFIAVPSDIDGLSLNGTSLEEVSLQQSSVMAKFDFMFTFIYNPTLDDGRLSCSFVCSRDLYEEKTVSDIARRFAYLLEQLCTSKVITNEMDQCVTSINKLSLILPEETKEMQEVIFCRQSSIIDRAPASFAQARIWHDEQIHFHSDKSHVAIYNMPFLFRLSSGHTLSVTQLRQALLKIIIKHQSLRTSLNFDKQNNQLIQQIIHFNDNSNNLFPFIESIFETDDLSTHIIHDEQRNSQLFHLAQGLVFRCHLVYYKRISLNDLLSDENLLIFNFHHAMFDSLSMDVFLHDLNQAYTTDQVSFDDNTNLRYLDYAHIEQQISMAAASMFWHDALQNSKLDQSLPLPFDRYRLNNENRSGQSTSISFDYGEHLSHRFLTYSSSNNVTLQHLTYTCFYAFLFKLTNGEKDLCIGMNTNTRFKEELMSIIGIFDNIIPLRCQLDSHWSFHQLLEHVQEITMHSLEYSYFPLQRILNQHPNISKAAFLDVSFEFQSNGSEKRKNKIIIGDTQLCSMPFSNKISEDEVMSKVDFNLIIQHDSQMNQLSCTINASRDLFDTKTIEKISQQFHSMLQQLFFFYDDDHMKKSIYELSLISADENLLMKSMNNTEVLFPSFTCIHHQFVNQAIKHPQKLAVELDDQSLTYSELLYYVQVLSLNLLNQQRLIVGEIVCQCVERSLSMVIGMMAIEMVGGVYCPLSPRDPQHRLCALLQQTQSRLVLNHHLTKTKFNNDVISLDIDLILTDNAVEGHIDRLSSIPITLNNIAYIIFTSGSTGIPKAVQVRQRNFTEFMCSLVHIDAINEKDIAVQMARCSFDVHVLDVMGTLMIGATLAMLHPKGNIDFHYLIKTMIEKQITYIATVPSLLYSLCIILQQTMHHNSMKYLRSVCSGGMCLSDEIHYLLCCILPFVGEPFSVKLVNLIVSNCMKNCLIWNMYGPAEATVDSTFHLIDVIADKNSIPIGLAFPNYRCVIMDEFLQSSIVGQEGELFVGGVGVFVGYLGRDDLTGKALVDINGKIFYRTGDLVQMDDNARLHYRGRKDHQIKLHGQRIELGEIEQCLLEHTSISTCVVIKWDYDHLVAYVQKSLDINENELREHCQSHLPHHMIPSLFIILDKLPLNANGKIDRKLLPSPSSAHLLPLNQTNNLEIKLPNDEIQALIHTLWCDTLHLNQISIDKNIFTIGGHSLLLMQLYHQYKTRFHLETKSLSITVLFQYPTISHHAQLIHQAMTVEQHLQDCWSSLYLTQARASFAQERIFLDEQIRFSSQTNNMIYAIPLLYRISSLQSHVSITGLHHALQSVIMKHNILRTALYFDSNGTIMQQVNTISSSEDMKSYGFEIINLQNDNIDKTIDEILNHSQLFDLFRGHVIHCYILRRYRLSLEYVDDDLLINDDMILFNIHHSAFDGASTSIFLHDFSLAYENDCSLLMDDNTFQYLDYSVYEHQMNMSRSRDFWHTQLERFDLERQLSLPVDQHRLSTNQRLGLASTTQISFNNDLSTSFLNYASSHHLTLFQLGLSCFYALLLKLTHGQSDLGVACINANRYRDELQNMIGMFVSTLPYRIQLDSHWPFDDLVRHVRDNCLSILEHSHYPLQHILADFHVNQSNVSFLETVFDFITVSSNIDDLSLNGINLKQMSLEGSYEMAKFDFMLTFIYNSTLNNGRLSCQFVCSRDLYEEKTIVNIARRFEYMFEQLFTPKGIINEMDQYIASITKLSLILPEENEEIQKLVFCRQANVVETGMLIYV
ncbi:unnamed protein product [Adineta steineri]|uniref:Carrier domain-containing protein n=1 Tax=Adineta steineri TaxID=433720 RepID=A0A814VRB9_9BILA|nr:unnamed protein product [Adineta steineri]CAF1191309.1 unnamed protein product [Adineta steineri]